MTEDAAARTPYRGLAPYDEADAPFFFGREREREIIASNLLSSKLTLLYGPSGVGKSSVLRAGVVADLRRVARQDVPADGPPEFLVVLFDDWRDSPLPHLSRRIVDAVADASGGARVAVPDNGSFAELLERCGAALGREILIILDQFEEYFLYHGAEEGDRTLVSELARAVTDRELRANVLIAIREDSLARLDVFKGRVPNLFANYLRIDQLDGDAARRAIERPIDAYNDRLPAGTPRFSIEPAAVDAVIAQVQTGQVLFGDAPAAAAAGAIDARDARIETPYLQLVMTRLWSEEVSAGSHVLRLSTLNALGGAERIVKTHLDAVMTALPEADQIVAAAMFRFLVTPSGTKIAHTVRDLADYVALPAAQVSQVLERLARGDVRILRAVAPPPDAAGPNRFQIFHDVLAAAILDWRARFTRTRDLVDAQRRSEADRVVEILGGQLWSAVRWAAAAGVVLTVVVISGLLTDPNSSFDVSWQLTAAALAGSILILAIGHPQTWFRIWRGARRALAIGYRPATILELLSKARGETAASILGTGERTPVDNQARAQLRRARILTAGAAWLSFALLPLTLLIGLMLGGRGLVTPRGVAVVTFLPPAILLLLALAGRGWQMLQMRTARSLPAERSDSPAPGGRPAGWPNPIEPVAVPPDRRHRTMRLALVVGALWCAVTVAAAVLDSLIAVIPFLESGAATGSAGQYSRFITLSKQVEVGRRYRVPTDPAISPMMAGRALSSISNASGPPPILPIGELPPPRALPPWLPKDVSPFKEQWGQLIPTLISKASMGFSPAERQYLERITAHPGLDEYRIVAHATGIDWLGARLPVPLPKQVSGLMLPTPAFSSLQFSSDVQIARAALLLSEKRVDDAEASVREIVSFGLALEDSATSIVDVVLATRIAKRGLDNLEILYSVIGRSADVVALRDARLSTATVDAMGRAPNSVSLPLDNEEARAALIADLTNKNQLRGIRWDSVHRAWITPCTNSRELLFGLDDTMRAAVASARADLVRSPSDAALFDLIRTNPIVPEVDIAGFASPAFTAVRWVEPLFGRRDIAQCMVASFLAIASAP